MGTDEAAGTWGEATSGSGNQRKDALLVFLSTLCVALVGLLALIRTSPGWFGLEPQGPGGEFLAPRMKAVGSADVPRPVAERAWRAPTLAQSIFADASPSVVHVTTRSRDVEGNEFDAAEFVSGTGSGWTWDQTGHVVTCLHVVNGASSALVTLADGSQWEAKLVGVDPATDVAVVRIDAPPERLVPVRMGSSKDLSVGAQVFSVSCPYGLAHSLSVGCLSGLGRRIRSKSGQFIERVIQTDAAMHPGSSGGMLLDGQGRMIGMNAAIHADSRRQVGVGFALPVDRLQEVVPSLIRSGFRWEPRFGFVTASDGNSEALLSEISDEPAAPEEGVVVAEVEDGGPAARAGLRAMQTVRSAGMDEKLVVRDVIVGADGQRVRRRAELASALRALEPGAPLVLRVAKPSGEVEITLEPVERTAGPDL
jgi:S1-C subfamily serine protease